MRQTCVSIDRGGVLSRLRVAAFVAWCAHLIAGLSMVLVLRRGLETTTDLQARLSFLVNHSEIWTLAWLTWTAAAIAILYFYFAFNEAHKLESRIAVLLTVAALGPDLSAQAIEIGLLPSLARQVMNASSSPEIFLLIHQITVILSGFVANRLYNISTLLLM